MYENCVLFSVSVQMSPTFGRPVSVTSACDHWMPLPPVNVRLEVSSVPALIDCVVVFVAVPVTLAEPCTVWPAGATMTRPMPNAEPSDAASVIAAPLEVATKPAAAASAASFEAMLASDVWPATTVTVYDVPFSTSVHVSPTFAEPASVSVAAVHRTVASAKVSVDVCRLPSVIDWSGVPMKR